MDFINIVLFALVGVLGASSWIMNERPAWKVYLDKLTPYQTWIGMAALIWGIWLAISVVVHLPTLLNHFIWLVLWVLNAVVAVSLGLLLGAPQVKSFLAGPKYTQQVDKWVAQVVPYRVTFGFAALVLAALNLLWAIFK